MKFLKYISIALFALTMIVACSNEDSIQQLYIDSEKNEDYLMLDIPMSLMSMPETASAEAKQAYNSIEKINLLAFKVNESNITDYTSEKSKVKKILKNSKYIELMRVNSNGRNIVAKYIGTENSVDELIVFASDNSKGFALARVHGNDMKPENMLSLLNNIKNMDKDDAIFGKIKDFFN